MSAVEKISLENIEKRYGSFQALKPTSLSVSEGEFLTLLGPSGSGKTTLLQVIAGLTPPSGGVLRIDNRIATDLSPQERDVGVVYQNYALFPHMTVFENVAFPLQMRRLPAAEISARVKRVLDVVHLGSKHDSFPRELSGGQQQRVALARSAIYEPSVILMDEPLGALDKNLRASMQIEIRRIHEELGTTIVYITHDQEEAMFMSNRICLLRDGFVEQLGEPKDLYFSPKNEFVATFLGDANILSGTIQGGRDGLCEILLEGSTKVMARGSGATQKDANIRCVIRPEVVAGGILEQNAVDAQINRIPARRENQHIVGSITKSTWRLSGGSLLRSVELTSRNALSAGAAPDTCVSIRAGDIYVLDQ